MVDKNEDLKFATFQILIPSLKNFNNGKDFLTKSFIPSFYREHFFTEKYYEMTLFRIRGLLAKNITHIIVESIYINPNITI